ncbi:Protein-disulfide isomerase [Streptomyces griseoaurantiacus M045]|uniref:Protein-disulfide isomerase n=2 Tax=Streptomyces griseoaurantiacus TaxID=68213 RepID=F3NL45_9ACTN|nr:Protein-disulfide isomerase [Streptomyces griseoaurantiacus M045]
MLLEDGLDVAEVVPRALGARRSGLRPGGRRGAAAQGGLGDRGSHGVPPGRRPGRPAFLACSAAAPLHRPGRREQHPGQSEHAETRPGRGAEGRVGQPADHAGHHQPDRDERVGGDAERGKEALAVGGDRGDAQAGRGDGGTDGLGKHPVLQAKLDRAGSGARGDVVGNAARRSGWAGRSVRPFHPAPSAARSATVRPEPQGQPQGRLRVGSSPGPGRGLRFGPVHRPWETERMNDSSPDSPDAPAAPVVLDIWCELQCPDCRRALEDLRALRARYGDRLEPRLRHFPLEKHKHAFAAAQAAEEAVAQGQGWPYVEAVLARVEELERAGEPLLVEVARELGLDAEEFDTALIDGRHILIVDADQAEGKAIGVTGTPTYVIGDERLDGGRSQEGLRARIEEIADRLLAASGS